MSDGRRIGLLIAILAIVSLAVFGVSSVLLYRAALDGQRERLVEMAQSQARFLEAVARFDARHSRDYSPDSDAATLSQIRDAHRNYLGFGETGEFTLARWEGNQMVFLLNHRHGRAGLPRPVPFDSELAEPMRRSLTGRSGVGVALDYRGETVLAAYEPVAVLNLGIVAKIDLTEIRAPFIRAAVIAVVCGALAVAIGAILFVRVTNPLLRQLADSGRRYRNALDTMLEGCQVNGFDWRYLYVNQAAVTQGRHTREDLLGRTVMEAFPGVENTAIFGALSRCMSARTPYRTESRFIFDEGFAGCFDVSIQPVPEGIVVLTVDTTERRQAEGARLRDSRLAALGQMAAGLAHEVNQPLTVISALAEGLEVRVAQGVEITQERQLRWGRETMGAVERIRSLIDHLRVFARDRSQEPSVATDVNDAVRYALVMTRAQLSSRGIAVDLDLSEERLEILGPPYQLEEVLLNFIFNARDTLEAKKSQMALGERLGPAMQLSIRTWRDGDEVVLEVEDNGSGMDDQTQLHLFEPFFTTKSPDQGKGLGLSISYGIVEDYGGRITWDSRKGEGTTFQMRLPTAAEESNPEEPAALLAAS